jgi:hypothetical protein
MEESNRRPTWGGSKITTVNCRPVSLTSIPCKILEFIEQDAVNHLLTKNLIKETQNGFMLSRSCATSLTSFWESITEVKDNVKPVDVKCPDFRIFQGSIYRSKNHIPLPPLENFIFSPLPRYAKFIRHAPFFAFNLFYTFF